MKRGEAVLHSVAWVPPLLFVLLPVLLVKVYQGGLGRIAWDRGGELEPWVQKERSSFSE
jgi:hypothetical protein